MIAAEPTATAIVLTSFGALLALSIGLSRASARFGVPVALIFLLVGMIAGSEGIGHIPFDDYAFAFRIGTTALVLILFDGGLNTPLAAARAVVAPAAVLATLGVLATSGIVAVAAHWLGIGWPMALLLGAIVSSTDAAAVFSVLTATGTRLRERVGLTLELESGLNDPMAVILTSALTSSIVSGHDISIPALAVKVVIELVVGAVVGVAAALGGRAFIKRVHLPAAGLYPAFTLAIACLAFGLATLVHGSGFLSVYVAGVTLGAASLPHAVSVRRVHDTLGWLSQVMMFLLLGLLVYPSRLLDGAGVGLVVALVLSFIARPLVTAACLLPFGYKWREMGYVGWVGLRGAVPIILAIIPVLANVHGANELFDVVFFIVVLGAFVPGMTVPAMTRLLGMESRSPPPPVATIEIDARKHEGAELHRYWISSHVAVAGATLAEIPLPVAAAVSMVERSGRLLAPSGTTVMEPGDYVYIIAPAETRGEVDLLFGSAEDS